MTVDPELITRKLLLVAADLDALRPVARRGRESYLTAAVDQAFVERYLERMIGRMIDVNYHVITGVGQPPPSDYYASFVKLGDIGVLDATFARTIARAAGLRNRLVHEYEDLDPLKVFEALLESLHDIPRYLEQLQAFLKSQG